MSEDATNPEVISPEAVAEVEAETEQEIEKMMGEMEKEGGADLRLVSSEETPEEKGGVEEFRATEEDSSMEETLTQLGEEEPKADSVLATMTRPAPKVAPKAAPTAGEEGTLTMTLQGNMKLKLNYAFEGQQVTVSFSDQAFKVELSDGTEFRVPVRKPNQAA